MTWFRVDDAFTGHHKLDPLLEDPVRWSRALSVWLVCGCYAARYNTDGRVTALRVTRECAEGIDVRAAFDDLLVCGLLEERDGTFWMHDFLKYNPTKTDVEKKREANRMRQKRHRNKARNAGGNGVTNALLSDPRNAPPARPDPARPDPYNSVAGKRRPRVSRLRASEVGPQRGAWLGVSPMLVRPRG